jgi:kumamolisin
LERPGLGRNLCPEARQNAGLPALPFLNPMIYPLLGGPCFRDIQSGSNGQYIAGPGYDRVTGVGVPNVAQLIAALSGRQKSVTVAA